MITFTVKPTSSHPPPCLMLMLAHSSNKLIISANLPQQKTEQKASIILSLFKTPPSSKRLVSVSMTAIKTFGRDFTILSFCWSIWRVAGWHARSTSKARATRYVFFLLSPSTRSVVAGRLKSRELFSTPSRGWIGSGSGQAVLDVPEHYRYGVEPVGLLD